MSSILLGVKEYIGVSGEVYDGDLIIIINGIFAKLHDLNVIPIFAISGDKENWVDIVTPGFEDIKLFVCLTSKIIFDPPSNSFTLTSMQNIANETEWRLMERKEKANATP